MFVRVSTLALALALAAHVLASPHGISSNQCGTGSLKCCDNYMSASQAEGLFAIGDLAGMIGLNCDDIVPVISGGASCTQQTVCCSGTRDVDFQVIGVDCTPVNLNA